jgi:glycerol-3-phosphate acyltransferase PlsY
MLQEIMQYGSSTYGVLITFSWLILVITFVSFLFGSIPFGLLVTRYLNLSDPRLIGSGNIGATNVLRTGNKKAAFITLILDGGKGLLTVLIVDWFFGLPTAQFAGLGVFLGHLFPVYLKFKGGKGVATFFGILFGFNPLMAFICCLIWVLTVVSFRYSSLAALVTTLSSIIITTILENYSTIWVLIVIVFFIWLKHKKNVIRLYNGDEPKLSFRKK